MKIILVVILLFSSTISYAKQNYNKAYIRALLIENAMKSDYNNSSFSGNKQYEIKVGKKYIKIISDGGVNSFVVNTDTDPKFKLGDVLMAASWNSPARNSARGKIFW